MEITQQTKTDFLIKCDFRDLDIITYMFRFHRAQGNYFIEGRDREIEEILLSALEKAKEKKNLEKYMKA